MWRKNLLFAPSGPGPRFRYAVGTDPASEFCSLRVVAVVLLLVFLLSTAYQISLLGH